MPVILFDDTSNYFLDAVAHKAKAMKNIKGHQLITSVHFSYNLSGQATIRPLGVHLMDVS